MKKRYSLAHLTVLGCPPSEMVYMASICGYDYISIRPILMGLPNEANYDLSSQPTLLKHTKNALNRTGVKLHDIELARIYDGVELEDYKPAFEVAAELGCKHVLSSIWTPDRAYYIEKFGELCEMAKQFGLTVNLEFVTWADVKNLDDVLDVLYAVKQENVGVMIDTLHFHRSRVKLEELDKVPQEWFHFMHICDGPEPIPTTKEGLIHTGRDARLYVGEGAINISEIVDRLPDMVYSIELPHIARAREFGYTEHARRCILTAQKHLDELVH